MCFHGVYAANTLLGARAAWSKPEKGHEMDSQSRSFLHDKTSDWERDVVSTCFFLCHHFPCAGWRFDTK